jgi:hypothetical protein
MMAEKTKDWVLLLICGSMIYGPRLDAIRQRKAAMKAKPVGPAAGGFQRAEAPPGVVHPAAAAG